MNNFHIQPGIKTMLFICFGFIFINEVSSQVTANKDTLYVGKEASFTIDVLSNDIGTNLQRPEILTQPAKGVASDMKKTQEKGYTQIAILQ